MSSNPFSPDYKPQVDMSDVRRETKISETRSRQRREGLASSDPERRRIAAGTVYGMGLNTKGKK